MTQQNNSPAEMQCKASREEHCDVANKAPLFHIAFYQFTNIEDPAVLTESLRQVTVDLLGSILVATEGINGVLAGSALALDAFEQTITDQNYCNGMFASMAFKRSACKTPPFARIKIHHRDEIVALGVAGAPIDGRRGIDVTPQKWRELLNSDDVVVIDNRNSFEYRLGRFKNAIDPQVHNFRDFSRYIEAQAPAWQAAGKRIAMYCTGGIRCEKTSAWMQDFGIDVYQLEGGILNYLQTMPDAQQDWEGECFVFDNRIALDARLQETTTTAEQVYDDPADAWRLARAKRLDQSE
ncbi:MAG: rhodanese-like domain-containing protein [Pseudomonadota bacterium]